MLKVNLCISWKTVDSIQLIAYQTQVLIRIGFRV